MDTSKQYIEMCKKAVEVQELWHELLSIGDYTDEGVIVQFGEYYNDDTWELELDDDHIKFDSRGLTWTPRQDQSQKMFLQEAKKVDSDEFYKMGEIKILLELFHQYWSGWPDDEWPFDLKNTSMEQLWLALVMQIMTEKVWNGKDFK